ncbi:MAG: MASE1 domain-containing protein [Rhodoferax sp.]|nr:MASE1 domain-containing protein [Rhodoferax sp.]
MKQSGSSNTLKWPGLLGLALLYAGILVLREQMFPALNGVVQLRPAAGLAVAALILWGRVTVWPIAAGALLAGLFLHGAGGSALALLLAGVSGPLAGVCLLYRQSRFDWRLRRLADYAKLMLCTAGVGGLVAALAGTLTLAAFGLAGGRQPLDLVLTWWAGEALGIAMLTPLILVWRGIKRLWTPAAPLAETVCFAGL